MTASPVYLNCFVGEGALGNLHCVVFVGECESPEQAAHFFAQPLSSFSSIPADTLSQNLVLVQSTKLSGIFLVRYFNKQQEILRCGSGSLAAAYYLRNYLHLPVQASENIILKTIAGDVRVGAKAATYFVAMKPLPYVRPGQNLNWRLIVNAYMTSTNTTNARITSARITSAKIKNVVHIGGPQDYYLLELADVASVKSFRFKHKRYSQLTKRALIVTAAHTRKRFRRRGLSSLNSNVDYVMRYFLPQYGRLEDDATGSANAMLAGYWQKSLGKTVVRGRQLSARGGEFLVEYKSGWQYVYGKVCEQPNQSFLK